MNINCLSKTQRLFKSSGDNKTTTSLKFYGKYFMVYGKKNLQVTCSFRVTASQFSSVAQLCQTLCNPKDCSTPGFTVLYYLSEFSQTHVHWANDAIQPSHPLSSPSPLAFNLSQHQGLFKRVNSLHEVAKVLEFQLQHQSFQWTLRTDLL